MQQMQATYALSSPSALCCKVADCTRPGCTKLDFTKSGFPWLQKSCQEVEQGQH